MREAAAGVRVLAVAAIGFSIYGISSASAVAQNQPQNQPGHSIAEKFSAEADRPAKEAAAKEAAAKRAAEAKQKAAAEKRQKEAQRKADEAEMLTTAKAEAEARRVELEKARAEAETAEDRANEERRMIEDRRVEEARIADEQKKFAEAQRAADARKAAADAQAAQERRVAEQKVALERLAVAEAKAAAARAEEARKAAELKLAEERRATEAKRIDDARKLAEMKATDERRALEAKVAADRKVAEERRLAEDRRLAEAKATEDARKAVETQHAQAKSEALAAERQSEAQRVLDRLKQAREQRQSQDGRTVTAEPQKREPMSPDAPAGLGGPAPADHAQGLHSGRPDRQTPPSGATRVTILLLMEPGNRGIRRHNKTADPLLCNGGGCFVSNGPEAPATFLPGRRALGLGGTFGARAGACSNALGCVFRGIELDSLPAAVQPIDMRVIRHDRREAQTITAPAQCRATAGRLACRHTIQSTNYVMWVVPEDVANQAGAAGLVQALADGLPDQEHATLAAPWRR